ncbi:MAG: fumarate hydratase [candidate division WOR-3 bacterium]|nr:fumarate hydratase [candidate division WOR-3 bacterium]MDW8114630.1 fumarate hydratase [candidate division WOR-3 bacterium]
MREIHINEVINKVAQLCIEANCLLGEDVKKAVSEALNKEESPLGKEVLKQILENAEIAKNEMLPICQDTGLAVVFLEIGEEVKIVGGNIYEAINEGVRKGYIEGYLRKSVVNDPFRRKNTNDNTPAIIHCSIVKGDKIKITVMPKGGGSENMSEVKMLTPAAGIEGVKDYVVKKVKESGANPCPPIVVGVGIGGTLEYAALLAKKALLREIGSVHSDPFYAEMERDLLERINNLGIGPQGFGGRITALAVFIEAFPCHIASLPVAVNINCHAVRHKSAII